MQGEDESSTAISSTPDVKTKKKIPSKHRCSPSVKLQSLNTAEFHKTTAAHINTRKAENFNSHEMLLPPSQKKPSNDVNLSSSSTSQNESNQKC